MIRTKKKTSSVGGSSQVSAPSLDPRRSPGAPCLLTLSLSRRSQYHYHYPRTDMSTHPGARSNGRSINNNSNTRCLLPERLATREHAPAALPMQRHVSTLAAMVTTLRSLGTPSWTATPAAAPRAVAKEHKSSLLCCSSCCYSCSCCLLGLCGRKNNGLSYVPQQPVLIPTWAFRDCCCRCCLGTSTMIRLPPLTSGGQRTCPTAPTSPTLSLSSSTTHRIDPSRNRKVE